MWERLFPPAFDGASGRIAVPCNVSNSFTTLNQTISFPAGTTSLLEIDATDLLRHSEICYPIAVGLLSYLGKHTGCVCFFLFFFCLIQEADQISL